MNKRVFSKSKVIHVAEEGKVMKATCTGDVKVFSNVRNKQVSITLKNVVCVQVGLRVNLRSVSSIE